MSKFTLPRPTSPLPVEAVDELMSTIEFLQATVERQQRQIDQLTGQGPHVEIEPLPPGFTNNYFEKDSDTRIRVPFNPADARSLGLSRIYIFFLEKDGAVTHSVKFISLATGIRDGVRNAFNQMNRPSGEAGDCTSKDFIDSGWKVFHHILLDIWCQPSISEEVRGLIRDLTKSLDQKSDPGSREKYAEELPYLLQLLKGTPEMPLYILRHLQDDALSNRGIRGTLADFGSVTFALFPPFDPIQIRDGVVQHLFKTIYQLDIFAELRMIEALVLSDSGGKTYHTIAKKFRVGKRALQNRHILMKAEVPWSKLPESVKQAHRERVQFIFRLLAKGCIPQRLREQGLSGASAVNLHANWKKSITCCVDIPRLPDLPPGPRCRSFNLKSKAIKRLIGKDRK